MSDIQEDVRMFLLADATVSSLVSTRIFTDVPNRTETQPFLVLDTLSSRPDPILSGGSGNASVSTRLSIRCYADTRKNAAILANAVRIDSGFEDLAHQLINTTRWIHHVSCENAITGRVELPVDGKPFYRHLVSQDYQIIHDDD